MESYLNNLVKDALELSATRASIIEVAKIPINEELLT